MGYGKNSVYTYMLLIMSVYPNRKVYPLQKKGSILIRKMLSENFSNLYEGIFLKFTVDMSLVALE